MNDIGVLSLQGGFAKHRSMVESLGYPCRPVRDNEELEGISGLIIPGGESTTIGMLLKRRNMVEPLVKAIQDGLPVFGTCAGMILLAHSVHGRSEATLDALDIEVDRNAYGSQIDSFEAELEIHGPGIEESAFPAVFIRAPKIRNIGPGIAVISEFAGAPVLVRGGTILAASFHPELTDNPAIHRYFIEHVITNN